MGDAGNPSFLLKDIKSVSFETIATPQVTDPYDVVVHIGATGICGSDVHYWQRGKFMLLLVGSTGED